MKHLLPKLAVFALPLLGFVGTAQALALTASSHKYFDETGALVGQDIRTCEALTYQAGNTHTAYSITEEVNCGSDRKPRYIVANTIITAYTLPGSLPIATACSIAECEPVGVAEPRMLEDKGWTWTNP
ncbi:MULTISPECIES: hypothetical protein [Rhodanobacteraceae]|uniref:hypothetical protein n=1 Tax=Rhodanobacteraceae TaxID=1775411 RepID=UPI00087E3188|nr:MULTISPECIES: hypothetical protein [Rhodanobacteraceae]MDR6644611.1 hypothetical protein [Luteibacter sp. 1214]SDG94818.1 hypothetical protein SAMN04515659_3839 [Dyella sp. 333MFSha]SKB99704.1 hypothetical protein SAMN05660880_03660 [Luteibacter sp. 22Crub2.1]